MKIADSRQAQTMATVTRSTHRPASLAPRHWARGGICPACSTPSQVDGRAGSGGGKVCARGSFASLGRVDESSFVVPDTETERVKLKGPPAALRESPLHRSLIRRHDRSARIAELAIAFSTVEIPDPALWETTILQPAADDGRNNI